LSNTDIEDTIEVLKNELNPNPIHYPQIIEQSILIALERKDADVELMSDFFVECLESDFFSTQHFEQGYIYTYTRLLF
jgi:hypothetical protein